MSLERKVKDAVKKFLLKKGDTKKTAHARDILIQKTKEDLWKTIIREWYAQQQTRFPIPEYIKYNDLKDDFGDSAFTGMGLSPDGSSELLGKVFEREHYGEMDEQKCAVYIRKSDRDSRYVLAGVFFSGTHAEKNGKILLEYAWENYWKKEYAIPECLNDIQVKRLVGDGLYRALGVSVGDEQVLLRKVFPEYGKIDDKKCQIYLETGERHDESARRGMTKAFFSGETAAVNARYLVLYKWKQEWHRKYGCPELIPLDRVVSVTFKNALYDALGIEHEARSLLQAVFPDYGRITNEKARLFFERTDNWTGRRFREAFGMSEYIEENKKMLLQHARAISAEKERETREIVRYW